MGEAFSKESSTDGSSVSSDVESEIFQSFLEESKSTSNESRGNCEELSNCDFSSLVEEVRKLEAYPYNSDGAMIFENLIAQLNEMPSSIIDYMGYVPNSVVRVLVGKWVQEFAKAREEEAAKREEESRLEEEKKKQSLMSRRHLKQSMAEGTWLFEDVSLGIGEDEFMVRDDERIVSKEDVQRLKKIRHEATQQVFAQSYIHKPKRMRVKSRVSVPKEAAPPGEIGDMPPEENEEDKDGEIPQGIQPQVLPRHEMDQIISQIRDIFRGDDADVGRLISGVLSGKQNAVEAFASIVTEKDVRVNFLNTILEPGYIFFLLNCHFKSTRAILNMIGILQSDNPARAIERAALSKKLNDILGAQPGSDNIKWMNFVQMFEQTCNLVVSELSKRAPTGVSATELEADFKDCLCLEELQMVYFANNTDITLIQLNEIIEMTLTCQYEALKEYLKNLAQPEETIIMTPAKPLVREFVGEESAPGQGRSKEESKEESAAHPQPLTIQMKARARQTVVPGTAKPSPPKAIILKGKPPKKNAKTRASTVISTVLESRDLSHTSTGGEDDLALWEDELEEEEVELESFELPELGSIEEEEDFGEEVGEGGTAGHQQMHRKYHKAKRRRKKPIEGLEKRAPAYEAHVTQQEGLTLGSEMKPQWRALTEEEVLQQAAIDEETCMDLIEVLKKETQLEDALKALNNIQAIVRNEEGMMNIEAIMRIYKELKKAELDLQQELEAIPKGTEDWNLVDRIIKAIQETASRAFVNQELEVRQRESIDQGAKESDGHRTEMIRERLNIMLKRRQKPRMVRIAPKEMPDLQGAGVAYKSGEFPRRQVVKRLPEENSSEEERPGSISDQEEVQIKVPSITTTSEQQIGLLVRRDLDEFTIMHPKERKSSEASTTRPLSRSSKKEGSILTMFPSSYLEKSSSTDTSASFQTSASSQLSFLGPILPSDFQDLSIEEQARYIVNAVISKIFGYEETGPKGGVKIKGESASKLVVPLERRSSPQISEEHQWRRKKTRILIERMQVDSIIPHSLKPEEVREALTNPEFEEVAQEFKDLYGKHIVKSGNDDLLQKITRQLDTVNSKIGESLALDKMVNLLSVLKAEDRKFSAEEQLMEYYDNLTAGDIMYLEAMLTVLRGDLLSEFSIIGALLPPQRIAWMSNNENWENHRRCLSILGQLLLLQVVLPELASIIVSALVMNVFDTLTIFNARDIVATDIEKNVYGYLKDEIEALSWFQVYLYGHDEVLKPLIEEYDAELGGLLELEENGQRAKPLVDKSLLDLVVPPGYTYIFQTGVGRGFAITRVDDEIERISSEDYMLKLRRLALLAKEQSKLSPVEAVVDEIERTAALLKNTNSILYLKVVEALEIADIYAMAERIFTKYYCRVVAAEECGRAEELFKSLVNVSYAQRKSNLEKLLFIRSTDSEILEDLEETNLLLHRYPPSSPPVKKVPKVYEFQHQLGREISIGSTDESTRTPTSTIKGGRLCDQETSSITEPEQMYTIRGAGQRYTTKVHFPSLKNRETEQSKIRAAPTKLPHLKHRKEQTKKLVGERHSQTSPLDHAQLPVYQRTRALHNYPLTKEEVKAIEKAIKMKKPSSVEPKKAESMHERFPLLYKHSIDLDQRIMEALFADPEGIRMVRRNPAVVLNQLRQELKPGELTRFLDEVMRETGGKKEKGVFLQALQKAALLKEEAKSQLLQSPNK
ncbi:hypothetical protein Aperf_G00000006635 [Anoplocephala perfoliata]